jgi:FlaA1/EpsC-like NDP-sugar epimerase
MNIVRKYFGHSSIQRTLALLSLYAIFLAVALLLSYALRFDFYDWHAIQSGFFLSFFWVIPIQLGFLATFKHFEGMLSYFRMPDMVRLFQALLWASMVVLGVMFLSGGATRQFLPRGVILVDLLLSLIAVAGFRISLRMLRERYTRATNAGAASKVRIAILGAGDAGASVAADFLAKPGLGREPVVFLDDDENKHGLQIHGIPVVGSIEKLENIRAKYTIDEIVIAIGAAPARKIQEIVSIARQAGIKAEIMPSLTELSTGQIKASRIRPVDIQDLLGREAIPLDNEKIYGMLHGKIVLVTGAGGSIGSELCRQIAAQTPLRLLLVERCEVQLFQIEQNLISLGFGGIIQPLVGDVTDEERMRHILGIFKPQIIFHAAAHKHVFLMERQPGEAVKNNSFGTRLLADLAEEHGIERFILISTDKAINPTNIMGASKRLAEIYLQSKQQNANAQGTSRTKFMAVRFGNVLGSSGSVIPIFRKQIDEGGPVRVTHPDVTRYFMTIPEAVGLVLQCSILGQGGEIFVLDMGKPVKIADLARQMIELSGYRPDIDIQIEFVGLRPGEKLFEELQHKGETFKETEHSHVMRFISEPQPYEQVEQFFGLLSEELHKKSANSIKTEVKKMVPEYQPYLNE